MLGVEKELPAMAEVAFNQYGLSIPFSFLFPDLRESLSNYMRVCKSFLTFKAGDLIVSTLWISLLFVYCL